MILSLFRWARMLGGWGVTLLLSTFVSANGGPNRCHHSLSDHRPLTEVPETDRSESLRNKLNGAVTELAALRVQIDQAKTQGKNSPSQLAFEAQFKTKYRVLGSFVAENNLMTHEQLLVFLREAITKYQLTEKSQRASGKKEAEVEAETERQQRASLDKEYILNITHGQRVDLYTISPGSFKMGFFKEPVDVTITKPFRLASTPTTQTTWRAVTELAQLRFGSRFLLDPDPSTNKGDNHPVESINWFEVQTWIEALNALSAAGEPLLKEILNDHHDGDIYRLPTSAEWEFVARARGEFKSNYPFTVETTEDYGWNWHNSQGVTQPVAQKRPIRFDGLEFYDMLGNVQEWVADWHGPLSGGLDPKGPSQGSHKETRGGGAANTDLEMRCWHRVALEPLKKSNTVGFRLAKESR